jgi:hypothetical protein
MLERASRRAEEPTDTNGASKVGAGAARAAGSLVRCAARRGALGRKEDRSMLRGSRSASATASTGSDRRGRRCPPRRLPFDDPKVVEGAPTRDRGNVSEPPLRRRSRRAANVAPSAARSTARAGRCTHTSTRLRHRPLVGPERFGGSTRPRAGAEALRDQSIVARDNARNKRGSGSASSSCSRPLGPQTHLGAA